MDYIIAVDGNITSFVFYNEVITNLHSYFAEDNQSRVLFDLSRTKMIDPLVLPNLLCVGFWILKYRGTPAKIYVPSNLEFSPLRTFLNRSRFVEMAQIYGLFEFDESISGGLKDSEFRTTLNKLELFQIVYKEGKEAEEMHSQVEIDVDRTKEVAWMQLKKSFLPFIDEFIQKSNDKYVQDHKKEITADLLSFCRELIENSLLHGLSFCFLNMQYSPSFGKQIKISLSDCGMGFKRSLNSDRNRSQQIVLLQEQLKDVHSEVERERLSRIISEQLHRCYPLRQEPPMHDDVGRLSEYPYLKSEIEGIVYGLLSRRSKPYGLYNIHHRIIHAMGGTIRIHSNDTQLILSERMWAPLEVCKTPETLLQQLEDKRYATNVRTGLSFKGAHIEIELILDEPMEGEV